MAGASSLILACLCGLPAQAAQVNVRVLDEDGQPVRNVVVIASGGDTQAAFQAAERSPAHAYMEQVDNHFRPHVLVVPTGTEVDFPNNDTVSHHVYSFSKPKTFELPLYKGTAHPPVAFDAPGLIVLGCNIHDNMLGYILVVDTPYYAVTDDSGTATIDGLMAGTFEIALWTPRLRAKDLPDPAQLLVQGAEAAMQIQFTEKLRPPHADGEGPLVWSHY